ncbi:MAG: DUF222 domain-containing protein [Marmoricola sp.]
MTTTITPYDGPLHPVRRGVHAVLQALADLGDLPTEHLAVDDRALALLELAVLEARVSGLKLDLLAGADDVAARDGARDAGAWLAHESRSDHGPQRRDLRLGEALRDRWHRVRASLASGGMNQAQAEVIVDALDALDLPRLDATVIADAETHLVALAQEFAPKQLRILGRRILDVVAPEIGEQQEARALELEEQRAWEQSRLSMRPLGNGTTRITALVPDATAQRLRTYLESFTSPRHEGFGEADQIPSYRQRGRAFCTLLEAVDPSRLPRHGGGATAVFVTVTLDALRAELATAGIVCASDERLSASEARRLACNADIIPVVLGKKSEILDMGRASRRYTTAQHKALRIRDRRCRAEGCTVDATWCEAHHFDLWSLGGRTDLARGALLCPHHHHRAHDRRYVMTLRSTGDLAFHRRT